jgi:hypothetical protein
VLCVSRRPHAIASRSIAPIIAIMMSVGPQTHPSHPQKTPTGRHRPAARARPPAPGASARGYRDNGRALQGELKS